MFGSVEGTQLESATGHSQSTWPALTLTSHMTEVCMQPFKIVAFAVVCRVFQQSTWCADPLWGKSPSIIRQPHRTQYKQQSNG